MAARPKDTRPHIIVVEDEQFQRETLVDFLDDRGYRASVVDSGLALRKLVEKDPPALVLLDLRLPGGEDGFSLARYLRERSRRMGIIMVTASDDTVDQVVGLETGADDYIAKPYEARALLARIKAVLRRAGGAEAATPGERVRMGKCLLDLAGRRMTALSGEDVPLRAGEFELLKLFAENPNRPLTRDWLLETASHREMEAFDRRDRHSYPADPSQDQGRSRAPDLDPHGARRRLYVRAPGRLIIVRCSPWNGALCHAFIRGTAGLRVRPQSGSEDECRVSHCMRAPRRSAPR